MKVIPSKLMDCSSLAAELASQPQFFEFHRQELPDQRETLPVLAAPRYNGDRSNDEAINLRVGAMRLLGMSDRAIERECGVDRRTIPHRLAWLEKAGRIPAVKDRLSVWCASLAEQSALALGCLMDRASGGEVSVELAAMIKSVATAHGITVEKMQLLTGSATEILEVRMHQGRAETEAWCKANAIQVEATVESESVGPVTIAEGNEALPRFDGRFDATSVQPEASMDQARRGAGGGGFVGGCSEVSMG